MPLSSVIGSSSIMQPGVCTSTTRPASPFDGQVIYMTDVDQTAVWDGTQWTVLAPIAGGRNVIINGAMQISQRGISTTVTGNTFLIDRWIHACSGSNTTIRDTASVPTGFKYAWKWTSGGSGVYNLIAQQIEYQNFIQMVGQTVTLSFYAKANTTNAGSTAFIAATRTSTSEDTAVYFSGTYTPASFTLTTSWARYSTQFTIGATVKSLAIEFQSGTASATVSTDGVAITGVQLEVGSVATPFEFEDYGTTLEKCQRYFQHINDPQIGGFRQTNQVQWAQNYHRTMRSAPTFTLNGLIAHDLADGDNLTVSALGLVIGAGLNSAWLYATNSGTGTASGVSLLYPSGSPGGLYLSAEL